MSPPFDLSVTGCWCESVFGADLQDVLAHPEKYDECQVDLVGIARVPGYFYLFADIDAAAKTNLSKGAPHPYE